MLRNQMINLLAILLISTTGLFAARKPYVFINNTGQAVNDIHIVFTEEGVDIAEPGAHSKIEDHITTFFPIDDSNEDDPNAIHRRGTKLLPNGGTVYGIFKKDGRGPIKIREWWWTKDGERVGEVQQGDQFKTRQSSSLIVPGEDIVRSISLKNRVHDWDRRSDRWDPVPYEINDLHIVLKGNLSPDPIDEKRKEPNDSPKYGGYFEDIEKVTCACDDLPTGRNARERELDQMDEPCKTLCKDTNDRLQVIHYRNGQMPMDSTIKLRLRGSEDFELYNWWWTQNGRPITFDPDNKPQPVKLGERNTPPDDDSEHQNGAQPSDEREFHDHVVSLEPWRFEGGTRFIANNEPEGGANLPATPDAILEPIYTNPELFERIYSKLGGEFYAEEPVKDYQSNPKLNVNLKAFYPLNDRLLVGLGYRYQKTEVTGSLPLSIFSSEPVTEQYAAKLLTQYNYSAPELILRYMLIQARFAFYGGVSGGMQFVNSEDIEVALAGEQYDLPYEFKHTSWMAGLEAGINYDLNKWLYAGVSGQLNLSKDAAGELQKSPSVGVHLGVKIKR